MTIAVIGATWRPASTLIPGNRAGVLTARTLFRKSLAIASPGVKGTEYPRVERRSGTGRHVRGEWVCTPGLAVKSAGVVYEVDPPVGRVGQAVRAWMSGLVTSSMMT